MNGDQLMAQILKKEGIDLNDFKRALVEQKIDNDITKLANLNSEKSFWKCFQRM